MNLLNTIVSQKELNEIPKEKLGSFDYNKLKYGLELGTWSCAVYFEFFCKTLKTPLKWRKIQVSDDNMINYICSWKVNKNTSTTGLRTAKNKKEMFKLMKKEIGEKYIKTLKITESGNQEKTYIGVLQFSEKEKEKIAKELENGPKEIAINLKQAKKLLKIFKSKETILIVRM